MHKEKKKSQGIAVLLFLKAMFAKNFTWLDVVNYIKTHKSPIDDIIKERELLPI